MHLLYSPILDEGLLKIERTNEGKRGAKRMISHNANGKQPHIGVETDCITACVQRKGRSGERPLHYHFLIYLLFAPSTRILKQ